MLSHGGLCYKKNEKKIKVGLLLVRTSVVLKKSCRLNLCQSRVHCSFIFSCVIYPFCVITLDYSQGFLLISGFNETATDLNYAKLSLFFPCNIF